jgi:low affinity Fe/Cu permease
MNNQELAKPTKGKKVEKKFQAFADFVDRIVGSPFWFAFSVMLVIVWAFSGFIFGFGQTWQLMINTTTTILTFLMIALLHSSQQKWEDRMERMQDREATHIRELKKETKKISLEKTPTQNGENNSEVPPTSF